MDVNTNNILKHYLARLKANLLVTAFTQCDTGWRDIGYIPDYNKFYYIVGGRGWLKIGPDEYYPSPGYLYLMPAGIKQSYSFIDSKPFMKYWCHFTARLGEVDLFDVVKTPLYAKIGSDEIEPLFRQMISASREDTISGPLVANSRLMEITALFLESSKKQGGISIVDSAKADKLGRLLLYIEKNLSGDISVKKLARHLHYHPNYLIRFFKKHMGTTPMHYVNRMRMEKAKTLLSLGNMPVSSIAEGTGFADAGHFSRSFKAHTGFSPSQFRNLFDVHGTNAYNRQR